MQIGKACCLLLTAALMASCGSLPGGVDPLGYGQERITTSIDDASTDVAYLDGYKPEQGALVGLVPRGPNGTLLPLPGLWEGTFWSYCLHAGVHRPGEGHGHAYGPLKGPDADIIRHILQNQLAHPEIEQPKIQALIWAILARTKLSDLTPEIKSTAQALLSEKELDRLNGGALGKIPPELLEIILAKLPPAVRQAARVNANLRDLLTNAPNVPYEQLERIAAPLGELPPPPNSRQIAVGRWSYDESHRLFVRYFPNGYTKTRTQFYAPEMFMVARDPQGRISEIADHNGTRVVITYGAGSSPTTMTGDPGVRVYPFASVTLTAPDPQQPWQAVTRSLAHPGWAMIGVPNGNGRATGPEAAAVQQRYDRSYDLTRQVRKLEAAVRERNLEHGSFNLAALVELGGYAAALQATDEATQATDAWLAQGSKLFYRAWMSNAALSGESPAGTLGMNGSGQAQPGVAGRALLPYDPTGNVAQPGNTGTQRLAQTGGDDGCGNGTNSIDKARRATDFLAKVAPIAWRGGTGKKAPWKGPLDIVKRILDFNYDNGQKITDALAGRAPCGKKSNFQMNATIEPTLAAVESVEQPSAEMVRAASELAAAWSGLIMQMEKAKSSIEGYRAASSANDQGAAGRHAREMANHLRATGVAMLLASSKLSALSKRLRADGADWPVTHAGIREYQQDLRAHGFPKEDLEAAKALGMSDEAIAAAYASRLEPVADWADTTILRVYDNAAEALQELGRAYAAVSANGL